MPEAPPERAFPEVSELVPHKGPMSLLGRVIEHDAVSTTCLAEPHRHTLFLDAAGAVPAYVGLEYMAQCVAAHAGLEAGDTPVAPRTGFLLGTRRLRLHRPALPMDAPVRVHARHLRGRPGLGAMSFECEVRSVDAAGPGELIAEATLSVALAAADPELGG